MRGVENMEKAEWKTGDVTDIMEKPMKDSALLIVTVQDGMSKPEEISAFNPPGLPDFVQEGARIRYQTEDYQSHHNFKPRWRNKQKAGYEIELVSAAGKNTPTKQPPTAKPPLETPKQPQEPSKLQKEYDERIAKEKIDKATAEEVKQHSMVRGGLAHDAAQMLSVLQQTGAVRIASKTPADKPEAQREVLKLTSELHEILLGHLIENAEAAEKKLRAKLELGSLKSIKTDKKDAIEANP